MIHEDSLDEMSVGTKASFQHLISASDVRKFVEITGDDNPLHVDRSYANKTQFKGTIAHGMLSAAFVSTLVGKHLPGEGALWLSQSMDFVSPVRVGDTIFVAAEVTALNRSQRVMDLSISITNQNKQVVIRGVGKVKVLENPPPTPTVGLHDTSKGVVIITGASRGIGAATAKLLAAQGYKVVINYHSDREGANEVAAQIKDLGQTAITWAADVSDRKQVRDMVNGVLTRFSQIDAVVNNATEKLSPVAFEHLSVEDFERHFQVGLCGAFNVVQESLPHLLKAKTPAVVSIGSINADGVPNHALLAYTAMKAALVSMTRSLASEFGPKGIRFNIVSPGMTDTGLISDTSERSRLVAKMQAPLRKLANPDDIAAAISFLLSPGASHITGETLRVCGGAVMI